MRRLLALLAPALLGLAACNAASNDDVAVTDEALVTDEMCATLDYGPRAPAADLYQFFATTDDASRYMQQFEADGHTLGGAKFVGITSDPRITKLVGDAFEGMHRVFPRETVDLPTAPPVALVHSSEPNAYAISGSLSADGKAPWIFVVHDALLAFDDDFVMGVIAHELGHLILRNAAREVRSRIRATYLLPSDDDHGIFGAKQANDSDVDARLYDIIVRERRVGAYPEIGFATPSSSYWSELTHLFPKNGTSTTCWNNLNAAVNASNAAQGRFVTTSSGARPPTPSPEEMATLKEASEGLWTALNECFGEVPDATTIADVFVAQGHAKSSLDEWMLEAEKDADKNPALVSAGQRFLAAEPTVRAEVIALRANPASPFGRIRTYDYEEDADDAAIRVMRAMGRDPLALGRSSLAWMTPEGQANCKAAVEAGEPIDFGPKLDPHPADCWRYHHVVELSASLAKCAPIPRSVRKPSSGGNAILTPVNPGNEMGRGR